MLTQRRSESRGYKIEQALNSAAAAAAAVAAAAALSSLQDVCQQWSQTISHEHRMSQRQRLTYDVETPLLLLSRWSNMTKHNHSIKCYATAKRASVTTDRCTVAVAGESHGCTLLNSVSDMSAMLLQCVDVTNGIQQRVQPQLSPATSNVNLSAVGAA